MLQPQTHLNKNGFDLSRLGNFTAKIGELLPILSLETVPGGHYEISVADMMRTIPMNNPAFIRASQHFEFYFVPFKQLWRYWDDFYTTRSVPTSALQSSVSSPSAAPCFGLGDLIDDIETLKNDVVGGRGDLGEVVGHGMAKIANLLGYPTEESLDSPNWSGQLKQYFNQYKPNAFRAAAYQKICFDFYRQPFYDLPKDYSAKYFNLDDANFTTGLIPNESISLQYKRLPRLFQMHYRQWKKDLFTGVLPSTQFGAVSVVNIDLSNFSTQLEDSSLRINIPPFNRVATVSEEDLQGGELQLVPLSPNSSDGYLRAAISDEAVAIGNHSEGSGVSVNASGTVSAPYAIPSDLSSLNFDVLTLVKSQAVQKWREITLRSGFRNVQQYEGHFGVKPIFTEKDRCVFIDSISSPLQVNTVTNTNAGAMIGDDQIALGDLAANGTSVVGGDKTIKFDAKDFGVIMCIYSMLPECTYMHNGIDLMNQKVLRDDFFTPEYENIGMQPITDTFLQLTYDEPAKMLGYVPRYSEYKIGTDMQSIEFNDGIGSKYMGAFAGWSPSRLPVTGTLRDFYVSPMYYRDIFVVLPYLPVDGEPLNFSLIGCSKTDTFIHQCYFDIKSVLPMSVLGLPQY